MSESSELRKWSNYFKVFGNPIRFSIVLLLYGSALLRGSNSMRFSEIRDALGIPKSREATLNNYLRLLYQQNFIDKKAHKDDSGHVYPLYHLDTKGREFLEELDIPERMQAEIQELTGR